METWDGLARAALLGTERQEIALPNGEDGIAGIFAGISEQDREAELLIAAGAMAVYRRAGVRFVEESKPIVSASETDTTPRCSSRAAGHLSQILVDRSRDLLVEWLEAAVRSGKRAPEELLPLVLTALQSQGSYRGRGLAAIGRWGRWLAAQNPEWRFATSNEAFEIENADSLWQTGTRDERKATLEAVRSIDPARGLALIQSTWQQDTAEDRAVFIAALASGLSIADELFLEDALDDRRKEIRRAACYLLSSLPNSKLVKRMIDRARPLIALKRGILGGEKLEVSLPAACDAEMSRDGIDPKPIDKSMGERAFWLEQTIERIPPAYWQQELGRTPEQLIDLAARTDWSEPLITGWKHAAGRHADAAWIRALTHFWAKDPQGRQFAGDDIFQKYRRLPWDHRDRLATELLRAGPLPPNEPIPAMAVLREHERWSADLARAAVAVLRERTRKGAASSPGGWETRSLIKLASINAPPELAEELSRGWPEGSAEWASAWQREFNDFVDLLRFRREMHAALKED